MIDDVMGAEFLDPGMVSGREAVATTVKSVSARASWIAIDPTPPAPPMMSTAEAAPCTGLRMSMRSNSASQAVIAVSGSAAACAKLTERGLWPTMRSSTRWNCALVPGRAMLPA